MILCPRRVRQTESLVPLFAVLLALFASGCGSSSNPTGPGNGGGGGSTGSVTITPAQFAFPSQTVGAASSPTTFTLTNVQTVALNVSSIQVAAPFSQTNTCGASVGAGQTCSIVVTYKPTTAGPASAALTVTDDGPGSPQSVAITGTATAPVDTVTLTPATYAFPNQIVGTASAPATFTLTNGSVPLSIASIQIAAPFSQTNTCGMSAAAGQSCTIAVTYTPTAVGPSSTTLVVTDNASGSPQSVAITGTGVAAAAGVTVAPGQYTFPDQAVGTTSAAANITLTNGQSTALTLAGIQIAAPFAQTNNCSTSLAPGQNCIIAVTYAPTSVGYSTATLTVNDDAAGSPQTVAISGNAVPAVSVVPVVGITFYQQLINTSSTPLPVTITNNQTVSLTINSITSSPSFPFTSACGGVSGPGSVAPGATCVISVSFLPQSVGPQSANVVINESAPGSPLTVPVAGTGMAGPGAAVIVSPYKPCVLPNASQQFSAAVNGAANTGVSWSVDSIPGGNAANGTITPGGLYTAPATAGLHLVAAVSADPSVSSGNTVVNVTSTPTFAIYPFSSSLGPGAQQSFQPQICSQPDGGAVTYSVDNIPGGNPTVGTVDATGVYTAPATTGVHSVSVMDTALNKTSGARVTVFGNVNADFGSRTATTYPIPPNMFGYGRAESIQTTADRTLLSQAGLTYARLYAQIPLVYETQTPDWTQIDPLIQSIKDAGQQPIIQMSYTPPFLQPTPNSCPIAINVTPTNPAAWGQIAASYVAHFDQAFPGLVQNYEIWNEPNAGGLCSPSGNQLNDYLALYAAAAPLMKQQATADGATIHLGGPVLSGYDPTWLQALTTTPSTAPYVDFISYHQYLFGPTGLNAQWDSYNGISSVYQATQDPDNGPAGLYNKVQTLVKMGAQPGAANTPVYVTEFNIDFAFAPDCCRNSAVYAPVWNALYVSDMLNNVYNSGAPPIVNKLIYFAGSAYPYFCLIGVPDANSDCLYSEGATPAPYPQYYAYQLLAAPSYLNLDSGGYLAASVTPPGGGGGPVITAFYEPDQDAIVITNPTATSYSSVQVTAQNSGYTTAQATLYTIASSQSGDSITSSPLTVTSQGQNFTATIPIPPYSVQAISLKGQ